MRSFGEKQDFKTLLLADPDVTRVLAPDEIGRAFDLDEQLNHVDDIFDRVFSPVAARSTHRRDVRALGEPSGGS